MMDEAANAAIDAPARDPLAPPLDGPVPVVDELEIAVVVDNTHLALVPDLAVGDLFLERFRFPIWDPAPGRTLLSEFGLSLLCTSRRGDETRRILFDFGYSAAAMVPNADLLGVEPAVLDALVLSHGHWDHYGGLPGFLDAHRDALRGKPFVVGGEECFCQRYGLLAGETFDFGRLRREWLADAGLDVVVAEAPTLVADHAVTTGQIGLSSFEDVLAPTRMVPGSEEPDFAPIRPIDPKNMRDDRFAHEIGLVWRVRDRGLVVVTMCGHRGVINTIRRAKAVTGEDRVHAVMGGFHLLPHARHYLRRTALDMVAEGVEHVIPMHCTGPDFLEEARAAMPGRAAPAYTGTRILVGPAADVRREAMPPARPIHAGR